MSELKIPRYKPDRVSYDEAVRMLDQSTAAQEEGLTRLTDIEREKVTYILKFLGEDVQNTDAGVEKILETIEKYRLLLEMRQQTRELAGYPDPDSLSSTVSRFALQEKNQMRRERINTSGRDWEERQYGRGGFNDRTAAPNGLAAAAAAAARSAAEAIASGRSSADRTERARFSDERNPPARAAATAAKAAAESEMNASVRLSAGTRPCMRPPGIAGTARGVIENREDAFYGKTAVLRVFITFSELAKQTIRYTAGGNDDELRFYASGRHIKVTRIEQCHNGLLVSGEGTVRIRQPGQPECANKTTFSLAVQNTLNGLEFRMQIAASASCPAHGSGTVKAKFAQSDLCLQMG